MRLSFHPVELMRKTKGRNESLSAENLSKEQSPPKRRSLFSFRGWGKQRRSVVTLLGGWPRVIRLLVMMFALSICYDLGVFSESTWTESAMAASGSSEDHSGGHENPVTPILLAIVMILFLAKVGGICLNASACPPCWVSCSSASF